MESCWVLAMISGEADFLLKVAVKDISAFEHFMLYHLTTLGDIGHIRSSFVLSTVKYRTELPIDPVEAVMLALAYEVAGSVIQSRSVWSDIRWRHLWVLIAAASLASMASRSDFTLPSTSATLSAGSLSLTSSSAFSTP